MLSTKQKIKTHHVTQYSEEDRVIVNWYITNTTNSLRRSWLRIDAFKERF